MSRKKNKNNLVNEAELAEQSEVNAPVSPEEIEDEVFAPAEEDIASAAEPYFDDDDDDFAPRHDKPKTGGVSPARIIISLTLICAFVAALLGAVNAATAARIAENTEREKERAIRQIFGSSVAIEEYTDFPESGTMEAYLIFRSDMLYGYCANVSPSGFGGEISMMVGVDYTGAVCGVNIVSMSETPGLGTKTNTPDFLSQFIGKTGAVRPGAGIDAISGATISSSAVCDGVNAALAAGIDLAAIAEARGVILYVDALDTTPPETETVAAETTGVPEDVQTTNAESGRLEDTVEYVDNIGGADAPGNESPSANIPVYDDTMVYITETTELDTDDLTTEETETTPPPETTTPAPETTTAPPETTTKAPETTTKEPETTTKEPETTETEETTEPVEETTGVPDETDGEE